MKLSYQHANPYAGRESVLVRIEGLLNDQTICILIDSGDGVDVDGLLAEDEYLTAVCLTHAHLDHYRTLGSNLQDGAQVYAAPDTARILEDVYQAGDRHYDFDQVENTLSALTPLSGWTQIVNGLQVRALPAGHTPGAASLLFAIEDGDTQRTMLATGDFSTRRAAGYPGFTTDLPIDVDVLLLSAAANNEFEPQLTEAVGTIYERARDGSTVLVTSGALTGVQIAYLLGQFADEHASQVPIRLVGQTATLGERLSYEDVPAMTITEEFTDPTDVVEPGGVTVAGPDVPTIDPRTSSARLFETIEDDPGATLVQIPTSGQPPVQTAGCTVHNFPLSNHPSRETIDNVVESLSPIHVVILHQTGRNATQYKDKYDSYVWATNGNKQYTLLDGTGWSPPSWVSEWTKQRVAPNTAGRQKLSDLLASDETDLLFPPIERAPKPDLKAEGLSLDELTDQFTLGVAQADEAAKETTAQASVATEATGGHDEATSTPVASDQLASIDDRLSNLESLLERQRYTARVIDIHDDVTILRVNSSIDDVSEGDVLDLLSPEDH